MQETKEQQYDTIISVEDLEDTIQRASDDLELEDNIRGLRLPAGEYIDAEKYLQDYHYVELQTPEKDDEDYVDYMHSLSIFQQILNHECDKIHS